MRGTLTGQRYVDDILQPHVGPFLNGLPGTIFQQDMLVRIQQELLKTSYLIPGRDGKVRTHPNSEIIRPIQRVFPLKIQSAEDVPLDVEALKIPSASVDVSESAMIPVDAPPNMPNVSRYGRTIQRLRRLNIFNVTTGFESK
ncbi:hypothetical protein TNCV_3411031 [Trichonephila clavipes]|nr:hypothetical protein TNCV_3411031 [Trichonephila clavipes]